MVKKILILLIAVIVLILYLGSSCNTCHINYVSIGDQKVLVSVADSATERIRGLSGRGERSMLFIFPESGLHGIWMKNMLFSIDIIWIDEEKKVIHIEKNISPSTYPEIFKPKNMALYILETPTGLISVKVGDIVDI